MSTSTTTGSLENIQAGAVALSTLGLPRNLPMAEYVRRARSLGYRLFQRERWTFAVRIH